MAGSCRRQAKKRLVPLEAGRHIGDAKDRPRGLHNILLQPDSLSVERSLGPAVWRPVERGLERRFSSRVTELHCPCGGCQSSTLLPSGSMTHPNFPYSESSVFSSTSQPSSRSALRSAARSSTR